MNDSSPVDLDYDSTRRLSRALDRLGRPAPSGRRQPRAEIAGGGIYRAIVTSEIADGTIKAPGSGEARVLYTKALEDVAEGSGDFSGDDGLVAVWHSQGGGPIEVGTCIFVVRSLGRWWALTGGCAPDPDYAEA